MRQAIEVPELEYFYLLIIGLKFGVLAGYWALMRWTYPEWEVCSNLEFIPPNRRDGHDRRDGALEAGDRSQLFA